jgi:high-affinity nickel-transport protein
MMWGTVRPSGNFRRSVTGVYAALAAANVAAWVWAFVLFHDRPVLLGTALLAYGFGLRHAVDADHIAAIDNVTRKLMQDRQRPACVGLFFALGHSTVVTLACAVIAGTAVAMQGELHALKEIGGAFATVISSLFLFVIAGINLVILRSVWLTWRHVRGGGAYVEADFNLLMTKRGFLARLFRPLFGIINKSWHMLPLGFLFGLGFDTATEIALLGISATEASHGISIWGIMVFPALFAAGMSLVDTTDGILMVSAYDWAFVKPVRKLYYNLTITLVSVVVAVGVGSVEALGLLVEKLDLRGGVWDGVATLNENFSTLGFVIIGVFVLAWCLSMLIYRYRGLDQIDLAAAKL